MIRVGVKLGYSILQKPARYTGGEWSSTSLRTTKMWTLRWRLLFHGILVAMSHLGIKILYGLVNEREDAVAERVFAPWHR